VLAPDRAHARAFCGGVVRWGSRVKTPIVSTAGVGPHFKPNTLKSFTIGTTFLRHHHTQVLTMISAATCCVRINYLLATWTSWRPGSGLGRQSIC